MSTTPAPRKRRERKDHFSYTGPVPRVESGIPIPPGPPRRGGIGAARVYPIDLLNINESFAVPKQHKDAYKNMSAVVAAFVRRHQPLRQFVIREVANHVTGDPEIRVWRIADKVQG